MLRSQDKGEEMNKDKIREIRDSWGSKTSIYELCDALLEEDVCKWFKAGGGMWSADCCSEMQRYPDSGYCPNCGCEIDDDDYEPDDDDYGPDPPWQKEEIISPKQPSLLPCPSCGGEGVSAFPDSDDTDAMWFVECDICGMEGPRCGDEKTSGEKWNALPRRGGLFSERMVQVACKDRENAVNDRWIDAVRRSSCIEQLCAKMGVTDE